jgi:hypothetical protein
MFYQSRDHDKEEDLGKEFQSSNNLELVFDREIALVVFLVLNLNFLSVGTS